MQWSLCTCSTCMFILTEALGLEVTWLGYVVEKIALQGRYWYQAKTMLK